MVNVEIMFIQPEVVLNYPASYVACDIPVDANAIAVLDRVSFTVLYKTNVMNRSNIEVRVPIVYATKHDLLVLATDIDGQFSTSVVDAIQSHTKEATPSNG